jgi:hypothetical protein
LTSSFATRHCTEASFGAHPNRLASLNYILKTRLVAAGLVLTACVGCQSVFGLDPSEGDCAGDYSYAQVGQWYDRFNRGSAVPGMTSTAFDAQRICIAVGVRKWNAVPAVEAKLRELVIPRDAIYIFIAPVVQAASQLVCSSADHACPY